MDGVTPPKPLQPADRAPSRHDLPRLEDVPRPPMRVVKKGWFTSTETEVPREQLEAADRR